MEFNRFAVTSRFSAGEWNKNGINYPASAASICAGQSHPTACVRSLPTQRAYRLAGAAGQLPLGNRIEQGIRPPQQGAALIG